MLLWALRCAATQHPTSPTAYSTRNCRQTRLHATPPVGGVTCPFGSVRMWHQCRPFNPAPSQLMYRITVHSGHQALSQRNHLWPSVLLSGLRAAHSCQHLINTGQPSKPPSSVCGMCIKNHVWDKSIEGSESPASSVCSTLINSCCSCCGVMLRHNGAHPPLLAPEGTLCGARPRRTGRRR